MAAGLARCHRPSDTATDGRWQRANPAAISVNYTMTQLGTTTSGTSDLVTQAAVDGAASNSDVDGGTTTIRSAPVVLPASNGDLVFRYYLAHRGSSADDAFRAYVEDPGGGRTLVLQELGSASVDAAAWATARVSVDAWAGTTIRLVFSATDGGAD